MRLEILCLFHSLVRIHAAILSIAVWLRYNVNTLVPTNRVYRLGWRVHAQVRNRPNQTNAIHDDEHQNI